MSETTPLRAASEQARQENAAAWAAQGNAERGREAFATHAAQLARESAERRASVRRAFGQESDR